MSDDNPTNEASGAAWLSPLIWVAAACLGGLIVSEALGLGHEWLRAVLIVGLCIGGTGIIIVQAQRVCPKCGTRYGYHLRILKQNTCRKCGAEFPSWPPENKSR